MNLLLDTNVVMEYVAHRRQYDAVKNIFEAILADRHHGYITQGSVYTLAYLTERAYKELDIHRPELTEHIRTTMTAILQMFEPLGITRQQMLDSIANQAFSDIEDSFQYQCAIDSSCDVLLTINMGDFKNVDSSEIEIMTPDAFTKKYM